MRDLETHEILHLLSTDADHQGADRARARYQRDTGPLDHVSRRRFLQGALAAGTVGGTVLGGVPGWFDQLAAAASPVGATEGILIVLHLGGGNDGLNTVVPVGNSTYRPLRSGLAIASPLPITVPGASAPAPVGLHPALTGLKTRFDQGKVAIIQGVGQSTTSDLSHFSSTASWMAGTSGPSRTSGWLGRWLDGVSEAEVGLRCVTVGSSVPLHLVGQKAAVTALDTDGDLFGAERTEPWMGSVYDAVAAFGAGPTGKGTWADRIATAGASSIRLADDLAGVYSPALPDGSLASQLTLVARLINANLGIRVFNVSLGSFDTHDGQSYQQNALLAELDAGVTAFYRTIAATWLKRVAMVSFSEFGRRPEVNGSSGTDHGTSSVMFVIGDNVKGGLYGAYPSLSSLDARGNLKVEVDYRSAYASVLTGWLGGDADAVLGGTWTDLSLFSSTPGSTGPVVTPPITGPWVPFATPTDLVRQQYLDFYGRVGDAGGVSYWAGQLTSGKRSVAAVVESFLRSNEFGRSVAPVARLALVVAGAPPAFDDLMAWAARVRAKEALSSIAIDICDTPDWAARYGSLSATAFLDKAYRDVLGRPPTSAESSAAGPKLQAGTMTRQAVLADLAARTDATARWAAQVDVLMTYAGLLRRKPDSSGWGYWVPKVKGGTSIQRLIAQFFASSEYKRRFTA